MREDLKSIKAAYLKDEIIEGINPEVKDMYCKTVNLLKDMGAEVYGMDFS